MHTYKHTDTANTEISFFQGARANTEIQGENFNYGGRKELERKNSEKTEAEIKRERETEKQRERERQSRPLD